MGSTIVVGLDGSPGSVQALHWAAQLAARVDARVQPVMAWDYPALALLPFPAGLPVPSQEAMQADAEVRAEGLVDGAGDLGDPDIAKPLVRQGSAGRVLCEAAASADLLAIGSRGLGSVKGVFLGSVSAHCANTASCPVAIIPVRDEDAEPRETTGLVVVGVDGSPASEAAIAWADKWAAPDATLLLVHAWDYPVTVDTVALNIDVEALEGAAKRLLDDAACHVRHHSVDTLRIRGDARIELARLATDADMLVIGARGHSGMERFLMGSVASYAVHHLVAPTVVVRIED